MISALWTRAIRPAAGVGDNSGSIGLGFLPQQVGISPGMTIFPVVVPTTAGRFLFAVVRVFSRIPAQLPTGLSSCSSGPSRLCDAAPHLVCCCRVLEAVRPRLHEQSQFRAEEAPSLEQRAAVTGQRCCMPEDFFVSLPYTPAPAPMCLAIRGLSTASASVYGDSLPMMHRRGSEFHSPDACNFPWPQGARQPDLPGAMGRRRYLVQRAPCMIGPAALKEGQHVLSVHLVWGAGLLVRTCRTWHAVTATDRRSISAPTDWPMHRLCWIGLPPRPRAPGGWRSAPTRVCGEPVTPCRSATAGGLVARVLMSTGRLRRARGQAGRETGSASLDLMGPPTAGCCAGCAAAIPG